LPPHLRLLRAACPYLFLVLGLVASLFVAWNLPPFMAADELAHVQRADLSTFGRLAGERFEAGGASYTGGPSDVSIMEAAAAFGHIPFKAAEKADFADFAHGYSVRFDGRATQASFSGAAANPPVFYLPASAAFGVAKARGMPVIQGLYLARGANALACVLIGFFALRMARQAQLAMYAILTLPMATALYGAVSCDGLIIATSALGVACIARAMSQDRPMTDAELFGAAACLALVGAAKSPYALFTLILLAAPAEHAWKRWAATTAALGVALGWNAWMAAGVGVPQFAGAAYDPAAQLRGLLENPLEIPGLAARTLAHYREFYTNSFVGILGWLDTALPPAFYPLALGVLGLAFAASGSPWPGRAWRRVGPAAALLILAGVAGVFLALYLIWSPVGAPIVEGVQGRYLFAAALMATLLVAGPRRERPAAGLADRLRAGVTLVVLLFPLASLAVVQRAVIVRYYLD